MRLFITHSGSNSQYEALYHGVPMLGIPMFAEQGWNCARAEHRGFARCLDVMKFTADELYDIIQELIENTTYRNNVRRSSEIWRDEPMIGRKKAGFWINHVIKFGGSHLRSPSVDQPLYQFLMIDIIGLLLIILFGSLLLVRGLFVIFIKQAIFHKRKIE
jgi:UDP-glucoronosyl and UDP-glucosyl transferase